MNSIVPTLHGAVAAVIASMRASHTGGSPDKMAQSLRISATDYDGLLVAIAEDTVAQQVWHLNPSTGAPWASADISSLQVGLKSGA